MDFKLELAKLLSKETQLDESKLFELLEVPRDPELGDFAFPCFLLAKELKKAPPMIASEIAPKISAEFIESSTAVGPYINFKIKKDMFAKTILKNINAELNNFDVKKEKICLESPGPNTNKPLHLGHVRNMLLGISLKNILRKIGHEVIPVNIVNDRGIHICKSMLAYKLFGNNTTPESEGMKGDFFVGKYYIKYAQEVEKNPELENQAKEMLVAWEKGDEEVRALWEKMNKWALDGMKITYKNYDLEIDKEYYESETYLAGKQTVIENFEKGIFQKNEEGAIIINLEKEGLGEKVLLRADGTTIYITQDIQLAKERFEDYHMDRMIYVVGSEQEYHFKVLFEVLKKIKFPFANNCYHLSYGMVNLTEGKMKSREGTIVDADDFRQNMIDLAKEEVKERYKDLSEEEVNKRAEMIANGAVNFFVLKYDSVKDFEYNPKKSLSFTGDSGPYIQYAHARICSIIRKAKKDIATPNFELLSQDSEKNIIAKIGNFKEVIEKSANDYKPSTIANYLLELAQMFNSYYHDTQIIGDDLFLMNARLFLIQNIKLVLKEGLALLNIDAPEEM